MAGERWPEVVPLRWNKAAGDRAGSNSANSASRVRILTD
jgi:hypothetical protein